MRVHFQRYHVLSQIWKKLFLKNLCYSLIYKYNSTQNLSGGRFVSAVSGFKQIIVLFIEFELEQRIILIYQINLSEDLSHECISTRINILMVLKRTRT